VPALRLATIKKIHDLAGALFFFQKFHTTTKIDFPTQKISASQRLFISINCKLPIIHLVHPCQESTSTPAVNMSINPAGFAQQANMPSQLCQAKWAQLSLQLSPFNAVVAIDEHTFMLWNHVDQQFVLQSYMWVSRAKIDLSQADLCSSGGLPAALFQCLFEMAALRVSSLALWRCSKANR
jgi:hypothetical protein